MPSADFLGNAEPVFRFEYEAIFEKLSDEVLKFKRSITLPKSTNSVIEVFYKNRKKTIAGIYSHDKMSLGIEAFVKPNTAAAIWKWYRLVYKGNGIVGNPKDYKSGGSVSLTDGRGSKISTWKYVGCYPSSVEMGEGTDGHDEIVKIVLAIEYDDVTGPD